LAEGEGEGEEKRLATCAAESGVALALPSSEERSTARALGLYE
jgi:hypothetical protein